MLLSGMVCPAARLPGSAVSAGDTDGPFPRVIGRPAPGPEQQVFAAGSGSEAGRSSEPTRPRVRGGDKPLVTKPMRPREQRIALYEEVIKLRKQGLSYNGIVKKIRETQSVELSKSTVKTWARGISNPYNCILIPTVEHLKPSEELAYIIGVVAGDGYTRAKPNASKHCIDYVIGLKVVDYEFAEEFRRCLKKITGKTPPNIRWTSRGYTIEMRCKVLHQLLRKPLDIEKLKPFIEHSVDTMSAFLRGFFDSEGPVSLNGNISVSNTDIQLLYYVKRLLERLGIETSEPRVQTKAGQAVRIKGKTYVAKKNCYEFRIRSGSRPRFSLRVGFTIKRKQQRLHKILATDVKSDALTSLSSPPPTAISIN